MTLSIPMTITNVTQAASAVVTVSGFNFADVGRTVTISGFDSNTGMSQLNGTWTVSAVSGQNITLSVNSTGFSAYVSGGSLSLNTAVAGVSGNNITTDLNGGGYSFPTSTVTFTIANPGVVNWTSHGRSANDRIFCSSTGTLPTVTVSGSTINLATTPLFVKTVIDPNSFTVSNSSGGVAAVFTGSPTGTATCSYAPVSAIIVNSALYTNTLRWAGKFSPNLATQTTALYNSLAAIPVVFPSQFEFSATSVTTDSRLTGNIGTGQIWGLWDQTVYSTPYSTAVDAIRAFNTNFLLKRDLDPASNDNDPMWLEKAA
jgi:hypothetical protein